MRPICVVGILTNKNKHLQGPVVRRLISANPGLNF